MVAVAQQRSQQPEVALTVAGPTLPALLADAGRQLARALLGDDRAPDGVATRVRVEGLDREALLVAWIDELLAQNKAHNAVFTRFDVHLVGENAVEAELQGLTGATLQTCVQAATFHGLAVTDQDGQLSAQVVLDVIG